MPSQRLKAAIKEAHLALRPNRENGASLEPLPICTPVGRYCCREYESLEPWTDRCNERIDSSFGAFGVGVTTFFKSLKALAITFCILAILVGLPCSLLNLYINGVLESPNKLTLVGTTLSGPSLLAINQWVTDDKFNETLRAFISSKTYGRLYITFDLLGIAVFIAAYAVIKFHEAREEKRVYRYLHSIEKYSIFLERVPPGATEKSITTHFVRAVKWLIPRSPLLSPAPGVRLQDSLDAANNCVHEVRMVPDEAHLLNVTEQQCDILNRQAILGDRKARLLAALRDLQAQVRAAGPGAAALPWWWRLSRSPAAVARRVSLQIETIDSQLSALRLKSRKLEASVKPSDLKDDRAAVCAFVTFRRPEVATAIASEYGQSYLMYLFQKKLLRWSDGTRLRVAPAAPPASVEWRNLSVGRRQRFFREVGTALVTLLAITIAWGLMSFLAGTRASYITSTCRLNATQNDIGFWSALDSNRQLPDALSKGLNVTPGLREDTWKCFCGRYASLVDFGTLESTKATAASPVRSWVFVDKTTGVPSDSDGGCWQFGTCAYLLASDYNVLEVLGKGGDGAARVKEVCTAWEDIEIKKQKTNQLVVRLFALAITLITSCVSFFLSRFMWPVARLEGHWSTEGRNSSLALRLFAANFIVLAFVPVFVGSDAVVDVLNFLNVLLGTIGVKIRTEMLVFTVFDFGWYLWVGLTFIYSSLMQFVAPHFFSVLLYLWAEFDRALLATDDLERASIAELRRELSVPKAEYAEKWATYLSVTALCYIFAPGIPLLYITGAVVLTLSFWLEKWTFLNFYQRPAMEGNLMARRMTSKIPYIIMLHTIIAAYSFATVPALAPFEMSKEAAEQFNKAKATGSTTVNGYLALLTQPQAVVHTSVFGILVTTWFLITLYRVLSWFASGALRCLFCGACSKHASVLTSRGNLKRLAAAPSFQELEDRDLLMGPASYNMLSVPQVQTQLGIDNSVAERHSSLTSYLKAQAEEAGREEGAEPGHAPGAASTMSALMRTIQAGAAAAAAQAASAGPPTGGIGVLGGSESSHVSNMISPMFGQSTASSVSASSSRGALGGPSANSTSSYEQFASASAFDFSSGGGAGQEVESRARAPPVHNPLLARSSRSMGTAHAGPRLAPAELPPPPPPGSRQ